MNYECTTQFNIPTSLLDCNGYKVKMRENVELSNYHFDIKPPPICFMPGQMFQGNQMAQRAPPPQLMDVELALRTGPLYEEDNDYITNDIHNQKPKPMPGVLSNRLVIPECNDIFKYETTKVRWGESPNVPQRLHKSSLRGYANYMRPGIDTKQQMKQLYQQYEKNQNANSGIYGVGKYDPRALKPGTNPKCNNGDSDLDCMHVYGPDATRDGKVIDPTLTLNTMLQNGLQQPAHPSEYVPVSSSISAVGITASGKPQMISAETKRVAESLDPNVSYLNLAAQISPKALCNAKFYGYTPPKC